MITIYITPKPQARPRLSKFRTYDPTHKYKAQLKQLLSPHFQKPIEAPVSMIVEFGMPIPKSTSKKRKQELIGTPHTKLGDIDNLLKALLDSMNTLAFLDDSQVYKVEASKYYTKEPYIKILLETY